MHSIFEVKHSIEEPRILLFTTQTPRIGDDELKQGNIDTRAYKQSTGKQQVVRNLTYTHTDRKERKRGTRFPFCIAQNAKWTESQNN